MKIHVKSVKWENLQHVKTQNRIIEGLPTRHFYLFHDSVFGYLIGYIRSMTYKPLSHHSEVKFELYGHKDKIDPLV